MPLVNEPKWEVFAVRDAGTPLGVGFAAGQRVYLGNDEGALPGLERFYPIVFNGTQIRYVTPHQVEAMLEPVRALSEPERATATRNFGKLEAEIVRSPLGIFLPGLPVWPPDDARPAYLPATFGGLKVHAVPWAPAARSGLWMADWWAGAHIYFQSRWIAKVQPSAPEQVGLTLRHEFIEQGIASVLAAVLFPRADEKRRAGLAQQFGGYAHAITVHIADGEIGESNYNVRLEMVNRAAGLGALDS